MEMITVRAAEFQRYFGGYQDEVLTQPVVITRNPGGTAGNAVGGRIAEAEAPGPRGAEGTRSERC